MASLRIPYFNFNKIIYSRQENTKAMCHIEYICLCSAITLKVLISYVSFVQSHPELPRHDSVFQKQVFATSVSVVV